MGEEEKKQVLRTQVVYDNRQLHLKLSILQEFILKGK